MCHPDYKIGNSKEFPTTFSHKYQLKSRFSIDNPYIEEDFRDKSIKQAKLDMIEKEKGSFTANASP
jgi:hypothetical protein